jgi:predicted ATPase
VTARYVLTGAPGAGKTTILEHLRGRGFPVVEEAATDVIARWQAAGIAEAWRRHDFCDAIVALQRERQVQLEPGGVQLFDRSPLCTLALARWLGHPVLPGLEAEVARVLSEQIYQPTVFFVRPLGFITATEARRISYPDALAFEAVHEQVYREHGFDLVDVAPGTVAVRAAFVESTIAG